MRTPVNPIRAAIPAVYAVLAFLVSIGSAYAVPTQCLNPGKAAALTRALQELIEHRQGVWERMGGNPSIYDLYQRHQDIESIVRMNPPNAEEAACMGFDVRFKNIHPSLQPEAAGNIMAAFLLLDESMYPSPLRDKKTRPEYHKRKIGQVIQVIDRFRYAKKGVVGNFNHFNKRITLRADSVTRGWDISYYTYGKLGTNNPIVSAHGNWRDWVCGDSSVGGTFGTVIHEYGHSLDYALRGIIGGGQYSSRSDGWKKLHKAEFVSPYGDTSVEEDFAESFEAFLLDPLMKCYAPAKYAWIAQFTRVNQDAYGSELPYEQLDCGTKEHQLLLASRAQSVNSLKCGH